MPAILSSLSHTFSELLHRPSIRSKDVFALCFCHQGDRNCRLESRHFFTHAIYSTTAIFLENRKCNCSSSLHTAHMSSIITLNIHKVADHLTGLLAPTVSVFSHYITEYYKRTPASGEEFSTSSFSSELADIDSIPELLTVLHRRITRVKYGNSEMAVTK